MRVCFFITMRLCVLVPVPVRFVLLEKSRLHLGYQLRRNHAERLLVVEVLVERLGTLVKGADDVVVVVFALAAQTIVWLERAAVLRSFVRPTVLGEVIRAREGLAAVRADIRSFLGMGADVPLKMFQSLESAPTRGDRARMRLLRVRRWLVRRAAGAAHDVRAVESSCVESDAHSTGHHDAVLLLQIRERIGGHGASLQHGHWGSMAGELVVVVALLRGGLLRRHG